MKAIDKILIPDQEEEQLTKNLLEEVLKNKTINTFIKRHKFTKQAVTSNLGVFLAYLDKSNQCQKCIGYSHCTQNISGRKPVLDLVNNEAVLNYELCDFALTYQSHVQKQRNLVLIGINREEYQIPFINANRKFTLDYIIQYIQNYPKSQKGIYLYGPYGCGKTYILSYLAQELNERDAQIIFAHYPTLVRQIKSAIGSPLFDQLIDALKAVEILILDDFGGEMPSNFIRDEVLGPILQDRMVNNRVLFMSSNLNTEALQDHLADGNKEVDRVRASRIFERLKTLMEFKELIDKNYR